jgi:hypothetical protein
MSVTLEWIGAALLDIKGIAVFVCGLQAFEPTLLFFGSFAFK